MSKPADAVGHGVARVKRAKPVILKPEPDTTPLSAAYDAGDWIDEPEVANLINQPDAYRLTGQEVMIFDLSKVDDLKKYNQVLTNANSAKANICIISEEKQFGEKSESWKVFLKVQHVQFKKLFKKGHKPDSVEEQERILENLL